MNRSLFFQISARLIVLVGLISLIIIGKSMKNHYNPTMLIGLGGDTMLGRGVNEIISIDDYAYPWGNLLADLKKPDITLINLENTFTKSSKAVSKVFNFKAAPNRVKTLQLAEIDVVNIANNHILDFDIEGLKETIDTLNHANIQHVGAGMDRAGAQKPVIITKHGIRVGIIGYTDNEPSWAAGPKKAGVNFIRVGDIEKVQHDIAHIKNNVDLVIASIHWGPNMRTQPSKEFVTFAHQMIDAGVDIIHGHSAHVFQGIEIYKNKLIMYDTGDLVDDYRVDPVLRNDYSFFFMVTVDKNSIKQIQLIPTIISNYQVNVALGKTYTEIINRMQKLSAPFGTTISDDGLITI